MSNKNTIFRRTQSIIELLKNNTLLCALALSTSNGILIFLNVPLRNIKATILWAFTWRWVLTLL